MNSMPDITDGKVLAGEILLLGMVILENALA